MGGLCSWLDNESLIWEIVPIPVAEVRFFFFCCCRVFWGWFESGARRRGFERVCVRWRGGGKLFGDAKNDALDIANVYRAESAV